MGEKQESDKKKNNEGVKKSDGGAITSVFKFDMHCVGCAKRITKHIKRIEGVESVKADCSTNTLVVTGKGDPLKIKEKVEEKTKKTVELVSQQPIKLAKEADNGGGGGGDGKKSDDKKPEEKKPEGKKSEEKSDEKKSDDKTEKDKEKPKEPSVSTVQFKTRVHCDGCKDKIKRIVSKYEGVQDVNVDLQKDLITAKGTMNVKELLPYLNLKLKRTVEIAPTKKDDGSGGDKKPKEGAVAPEKPKDGDSKSEKPEESGGDKKESGGGDKKKDGSVGEASSSKDNTTRIEVNKMEYYPSNYDYGYAQIYDPRPQGEGYGHQVTQYWQASEYSHAPEMFSDENPNACSVM